MEKAMLEEPKNNTNQAFFPSPPAQSKGFLGGGEKKEGRQKKEQESLFSVI